MADGCPLPLVFLPGMDGAGDIRGSLVERLSRQRVVQLIEYPRHLPLGYDALCDYVSPALPTGRFVAMGESFGGPIAIEIASRFKDRCARVILAGSYIRPPFPKPVAGLAEWIDPRAVPHRLIEWVMLGGVHRPKLRRDFRRLLGDLDWKVMQSRAIEALRSNHEQRFRQLTCPVLCLAGRHDRLMGRRSVAAIRAARPDVEVHWLDAPHMLLETHPVESAALIETFCGSAAE